MVVSTSRPTNPAPAAATLPCFITTPSPRSRLASSRSEPRRLDPPFVPLGVAGLPERERRAVGLGGNGLVVFAGEPEEQEAAAAFVRFLTSTPLTAELGVTSGYVAIRESAMAEPAIKELFAIKTDGRMTTDGALVLFHDGTVDRASDGAGPVDDHTLDELQGLDLGGWFASR